MYVLLSENRLNLRSNSSSQFWGDISGFPSDLASAISQEDAVLNVFCRIEFNDITSKERWVDILDTDDMVIERLHISRVVELMDNDNTLEVDGIIRSKIGEFYIKRPYSGSYCYAFSYENYFVLRQSEFIYSIRYEIYYRGCKKAKKIEKNGSNSYRRTSKDSPFVDVSRFYYREDKNDILVSYRSGSSDKIRYSDRQIKLPVDVSLVKVTPPSIVLNEKQVKVAEGSDVYNKYALKQILNR